MAMRFIDASDAVMAAGCVALKLRDEHGITTVSMAVCIFLSLALIFTGAQLYKVQSAAADIQDVADVAALAAENEVAEFMVAANMCDAVVLSMTLLSTTMYGIGVVAACIPPLAELSASLVEMGTKVARARDRFSEAACKGLEQLQRVLPFLAAANAAGVAQANGGQAIGADYFALGMLVPATGEAISAPGDGLAEAGSTVEERTPDIRAVANEAEEVAEEAQREKLRGFMADCGEQGSGGKCMYERFARQDGSAGSENPLYSSVDAWSFEVAYDRARCYFAMRAQREDPNAAGSVEQKADSVLRKKYFHYVKGLLETGAGQSGASGIVVFPELFHTMAGLRQTPLYASVEYPVTQTSTGKTMHAMTQCPDASGYARMGSIQELDKGGFVTCSSCKFVASDLANVGSANTNVATGFEYHYNIVRDACSKYNDAIKRLEPLKQKVEDDAGSLFDALGDVTAEAGSCRIHAAPPGRMGAIALTVNTARSDPASGFESTFVSSGTTLGLRAAVSGATLLGDSSDSGASVITALLDGFGEDGGAVVGAARVALDCWSGLLRAYEDGQAALDKGLTDALNGVNTSTLSGLGDWASGALRDGMAAAGLEPVQLDALKPVTVGTAQVASADTGPFAVRFMQVKRSALAASTSSTDLFSALAASAGADMHSDGIDGDSVTIAEWELPLGDATVPIVLSVPSSAEGGQQSIVSQCISMATQAAARVAGMRSWQ